MLLFTRLTVIVFAMMIASVCAIWPAIFLIASTACHQLRTRGGLMIDVVAIGTTTGGLLI